MWEFGIVKVNALSVEGECLTESDAVGLCEEWAKARGDTLGIWHVMVDDRTFRYCTAKSGTMYYVKYVSV